MGLLEGHEEYECWMQELGSIPQLLSLAIFF